MSKPILDKDMRGLLLLLSAGEVFEIEITHAIVGVFEIIRPRHKPRYPFYN